MLYFGPSPPLSSHLYGTVALHVGVYHPFRIRMANGKPVTCRCAIAPPIQSTNLIFPVEYTESYSLRETVPTSSIFNRGFGIKSYLDLFFRRKKRWIVFVGCMKQTRKKTAVEACLNRLLKDRGQLQHTMDPRIQSIIDLLREEPDRNFSQEQLATLVNLSPSRLLHLFKQHTSVSYRRFRMWKRLLLAVEQFNRTDNMTRVALDSGFADATHFSHCFRDTFGVNPAFVFRGIKRFEVSSPDPDRSL